VPVPIKAQVILVPAGFKFRHNVNARDKKLLNVIDNDHDISLFFKKYILLII